MSFDIFFMINVGKNFFLVAVFFLEQLAGFNLMNTMICKKKLLK